MNNYLQINIGGKLRGWKINQMTIEIWSKQYDKDAAGASSTYGVVFGGLKANCYAKQEDEDFTLEDVCNWVDDMQLTEEGRADLKAIKDAFESSQHYIAILQRLNNELDAVKKEVKKKVVPSKKKK